MHVFAYVIMRNVYKINTFSKWLHALLDLLNPEVCWTNMYYNYLQLYPQLMKSDSRGMWQPREQCHIFHVIIILWPTCNGNVVKTYVRYCILYVHIYEIMKRRKTKFVHTMKYIITRPGFIKDFPYILEFSSSLQFQAIWA